MEVNKRQGAVLKKASRFLDSQLRDIDSKLRGTSPLVSPPRRLAEVMSSLTGPHGLIMTLHESSLPLCSIPEDLQSLARHAATIFLRHLQAERSRVRSLVPAESLAETDEDILALRRMLSQDAWQKVTDDIGPWLNSLRLPPHNMSSPKNGAGGRDMAGRTKLFISYAHRDAKHLTRLMIHLRPYERLGLIEAWSDQKIKTGSRWREEISAAMDRAAVAVLLVSADFLASDFIAENELPPLLSAATAKGMKIMPIILSACAFEKSSLGKYQAANAPSKPLIRMHAAHREDLWSRLASEAAEALHATPDAVPTDPGMETFDDARGMISEEIQNPAVIRNFLVYEYEHIDFLDFMPAATEIFAGAPNLDQILQEIKKRLTAAGWHGDGEIQALWLPPFTGVGVEDTFGRVLWHVKQDHGGTSWIASPVPLPFPSLGQPR